MLLTIVPYADITTSPGTHHDFGTPCLTLQLPLQLFKSKSIFSMDIFPIATSAPSTTWPYACKMHVHVHIHVHWHVHQVL